MEKAPKLMDYRLQKACCTPASKCLLLTPVLDFTLLHWSCRSLNAAKPPSGWPKIQTQQLPVLANIVRSLETIKLEVWKVLYLEQTCYQPLGQALGGDLCAWLPSGRHKNSKKQEQREIVQFLQAEVWTCVALFCANTLSRWGLGGGGGVCCLSSDWRKHPLWQLSV